MKGYSYILMTGIISTMLMGCSKEDDILPEKTDPIEEEKVEEVKKMLKINAAIEQPVSRAVKEHSVFAAGDQMGIWTDSFVNEPATYNGTSWNGAVEYTGSGEKVYAILPYIKENTDRKNVMIDMTRQEDFIYASGTTTEEADVNLTFRHALTQVRLNIKNIGYTGTGKVEKVVMKNVAKNAGLNIEDGTLTNDGTVTDINIGGNYNIADGTVPAGIFAPTASTQSIQMLITIDGKDYEGYLNNSGWKAGYIYTYIMQIKDEDSNIRVFDDEDVDVEYWTTYGKEDKVTKVTFTMDWDKGFDVAPTYAVQGWKRFKDHAAMFGVWFAPGYNDWRENWNVRIRLLYLDDDGNIKGQSPARTYDSDEVTVFYIFDYINLEVGHYRVMPVVQFEGDSNWYQPVSSGYYYGYTADDYTKDNFMKEWDDTNWGFDVVDGTDKLMVRDVWCPKVCYPGHYQIANDVAVGEEFDINFILTNNSRKAMKGTIIAKDERGYSKEYECYRLSDKYTGDEYVMDEWSKEIGRLDISLPAGARNWESTVKCKIDWVNSREMSNSLCRLYFQPEGSSEQYLLLKDWAPILNAHQTDPSDMSFWGANITRVRTLGNNTRK